MTPQITYLRAVNSRELIVEVRKNWDMNLYCNGSKSGDDDGPFTMRYTIEKTNGQWYITHKLVASTQ